MTTLTTLAGQAAHAPYDGGFHWWFLFFPFGFILFWVLFALLLRGLFWRRWGGRGPWGPPGHVYGARPTASAEQALASRFAAGDIDEREYRARLEVLRATTEPGG